MRIPLMAAALAAAFAMSTSPAQAQFGSLSKIVQKAGIGLPGLQKAPITTSLEDARWGVADRDSFTPSEPKRPLLDLPRTSAGAFVLQAGYFELQGQSYCLKAGTHGPGGGDGYLFAPTKGPAADAVMSIVRNSVKYPEIDQRDIQTLLWAIIARAKFEELPTQQKTIAARLLSPRQLASLNRSALNMLGSGLIADNLPSGVREVLQAEAELRRKLAVPGTSFTELERVAMLSGVAGIGPGSIDVPAGRWNLHPDGYYVRYLPRSYSDTVVQIWVPQGSAGVGKEYDPATHVAVPGNTARQRLILSGRPYIQH